MFVTVEQDSYDPTDSSKKIINLEIISKLNTNGNLPRKSVWRIIITYGINNENMRAI